MLARVSRLFVYALFSISPWAVSGAEPSQIVVDYPAAGALFPVDFGPAVGQGAADFQAAD
jgi:hypothetical protein